MKKAIYFLFFVLLITSVSAVCTVNFDEDEYNPGETVAATMICTSSTEKNKEYILSWSNSTSIVETDVGITPSVTGSPFFETYEIPLDATNWTNANATLTGSNLEGIDYFNVTGTSSNILTINNVIFYSKVLMGNLFSVMFTVRDTNNLEVNNAVCEVFSSSSGGNPLQECGEVVTYNGKAICGDILNSDTFIENNNYLVRIGCICGYGDNSCFDEEGTQIQGARGSTAFPFSVSRWLNVSTITDKKSYTLSDDYIFVCANITNNQEERLSLEINYNYRCGSSDSSTERIIIDEYKELRGISNLTTQNQCAQLQIKNKKGIQNKENNCYAATDVRILRKNGEIKFTYATTSSNFTITSNTDSLLEEDGENMIAIALILVGVMFFLIYISTKLETRNEKDEVIPLNSLIVMIFWTMAGYIAFFIVQLSAGIALVQGFDNQIVSSILGIHQFVNAATIIMLFILFFGVFINIAVSAIDWLQMRLK